MIPWITSAGTLLAVWLSGRNLRLSWKVSLVNQALWLVFIVTYDAWGLLPLTLALAAIFSRHLWRTRDDHPDRHGRRRRASRSCASRPGAAGDDSENGRRLSVPARGQCTWTAVACIGSE